MVTKYKYSWGEVEDLWQRRFGLLAKESGLPVDVIIDSRLQLLSAFDDDWLKKDYRRGQRKDKYTLGEILSPSITKMLSNPVVNNAVQIVELAKYLSELRNQPNINEIIVMLRNKSQFEATRLNLAISYRFLKVGFENLVVEPEIPRGKGDIQCSYKGDSFIVECSILVEDNLERYFTDLLVLRIEKGIKDKVLEVGIEIEFSKRVNNQSIDETIEQIRKARHKYGRKENVGQWKGASFISSVAKGRIFKLSATDRTTKPDMRKWDVVLGLAFRTPKEKGNIYSINLDKQMRTGMIFLKGLRPKKRPKSLYERVKKRIESKRSQTHGLDKEFRRLFVFMTEKRVESFDWSKIWDGIRPSFKAKNNIAGMLFVDRRQTILDGKIRYAYPQILFHNPYFPSVGLEKSFPKLEKLERSDWIIK